MALDTQTNVDKEINEGILRTYLGVDDPPGIDFLSLSSYIYGAASKQNWSCNTPPKYYGRVLSEKIC